MFIPQHFCRFKINILNLELLSVLPYSDGITFVGLAPLPILWLDRIRLDPTLRSDCYWLQ